MQLLNIINVICSYTPAKASRIIAACVVLHNWAVDLGTPLLVAAPPHQPFREERDARVAAQRATTTGKAARDAIVQRYFSR